MKRVMVLSGLGLLVLGLLPAWADDARPTFTKDVLPILQENCQTCHRPAGRNMSGMVAPMSLMTYEEVRPWAKAMARAVQDRIMPPWHATDATHGVFKNERTLTQKQIDTIIRWVETGAARGDAADAPAPVQFRDGWYMGDPDLVLSFNEPYFVEDHVEDLYHNITVTLTEDQLPEDRWITSMEFKPGSEVVHHVIAYASSGGAGSAERDHLGGLAPGTDAADYPEGYGKLLRKGSDFIFAMHYHKEAGPGTGKWDNTEVAIKFHPKDKPVQHPLETSPISYGPFEIPPYHSHWKVGGVRVFDEDIDIISLMPHTHLRGAKAKYTAYYPDGTSEVLLDVPRYDFNWQTQYIFKEIKRIPAGTRIEWEIVYDNSEENGRKNGFDPSQAVRFGQPTTDEMDLGWMTFSPSKPQLPSQVGD